MRFLNLFFILSIITATFIFGLPVLAQQFQLPGINTLGSVNLDASPGFPGAHEETTVTLTTSSADANSSRIDWYVDGAYFTGGIGMTEINVRTGALGSSKSVYAELSGARFLTGSIVLRPAEVSLAWEADTYTPPFYRGKALFSDGSALRLVALPSFVHNGRQLSASSLVYKWIRDGRVMGSSSGFGRSSYKMNGVSASRGMSTVRVEVSTTDGALMAVGSAVIKPVSDPSIIMYPYDPLMGVIYHRSLQRDMVLDEDEITLVAEPYFFSIGQDGSVDNIRFDWTMNGQAVQSRIGKPGSRLTFTRGEETGMANVGVSVSDIANLSQQASARLSIELGL